MGYFGNRAVKGGRGRLPSQRVPFLKGSRDAIWDFVPTGGECRLIFFSGIKSAVLLPYRVAAYTTGGTSLMAVMRSVIPQFLNNPLTKFQQSLYDDILLWARTVQETAYADLDSIHNLMISSITPGLISMCSTSLIQRNQPLPFDDRQYYSPVFGLLMQKLMYQAQGLQ